MPHLYSKMFCEDCGAAADTCRFCGADAAPCRPEFGMHVCHECDGDLCHPELNLIKPHFMRLVEKLPISVAPEDFEDIATQFKDALKRLLFIDGSKESIIACLNSLQEEESAQASVARHILENAWLAYYSS
jgi:hypothetical protein